MRHNIEFFSELCCDECKAIIHYHFDCPACKSEYAGTSIYGLDIYELRDDEKEFRCEKCKTQFKIISTDGCNAIVENLLR